MTQCDRRLNSCWPEDSTPVRPRTGARVSNFTNEKYRSGKMEPTKYNLRFLDKLHDDRRHDTDGVRSLTSEEQVSRTFRNLCEKQ